MPLTSGSLLDYHEGGRRRSIGSRRHKTKDEKALEKTYLGGFTDFKPSSQMTNRRDPSGIKSHLRLQHQTVNQKTRYNYEI